MKNLNDKSDFFKILQDRECRIDRTIDYLDDLLLESNFEEVDLIFHHLRDNLEMMVNDLTLTLSFLMVSNGAQDRLPHRKEFCEELKKRLLLEMPESKVRSLLGGLE